MAHIYLFSEHEDFQTGKSKLNKGAVMETHVFGIALLLLAGLGMLAWGGGSYRWQWRYNATGAETNGIVIDCREQQGSKGGSTTYVEYRYTVSDATYGDVTYEDEDRVGSGRLCGEYPYGLHLPVYYLSDAPYESGIGAFLHSIDFMESFFASAIGICIMLVTFYVIMKNRREQYKHALLQRHADMLIEATVETVGEVKGKGGYKYADYVFTSPDMGLIYGQIRNGKGYRWPHQIKRFDSLTILYLDSNNYCVL